MEPENNTTYSRRRSQTTASSSEPEFALGAKLNSYERLRRAQQKEPSLDSTESTEQGQTKGGISPLMYGYMKEKAWDKTSAGREVYQTKASGERKTPAAYEVQEEEKPKTEKAKKRVPAWLSVVLIVFIASTVLLIFGLSSQKEEPAAVHVIDVPSSTVLPDALNAPNAPNAYDFPESAQMSGEAVAAISKISGTVDMKVAFSTPSQIITRNLRKDQSYDFYVFDSEGNLQCYFEGLQQEDVFSGENNTLYVAQSPYLLQQDGSALIPGTKLKSVGCEGCVLKPLHEGWSLIQADQTGELNMISTEGKLLCDRWMCRLFPFTGQYTAGCADTGNIGSDDRYLWYVIGKDGVIQRWFSSAGSEAVTAVLCDLAFMQDGTVVSIPSCEVLSNLCARAILYPDLQAAVLYDENGNCGLWKDGRFTCECRYQQITHSGDAVIWDETPLYSGSADLRIYTLSPLNARRPVSCVFTLISSTGTEYISLSTVSEGYYQGASEFSAMMP